MIDWFWCGSAFRALRAARRIPSARALELTRRSRAALELAGVALAPMRAVDSRDALGCDLCAQSVYWSLLARESLDADTAAARTGLEMARPTLESLWRRADRAELERAAGDAESAETMGRALVGRTFADYAESSADEQARLSRSLLPFAEALFNGIDGAAHVHERLWYRRLRRLSIPIVAIAVAAVGIAYGLERWERARDIARDRPWVASSHWPQPGCPSPAQECSSSPAYFFSTVEQNDPWVEFDLGSPQPVSGFSITNRLDCCSDRAIPLIIEVSTDHTQWKEVARRTEDFHAWKGSFRSTKARWVRLRVPRLSFLHLSRVRLFR